MSIFLFGISVSTHAQQATEIDPKFVKLPRYADLSAITSAITSPTQGMMVFNIGTGSNWVYNGSVWGNMVGSGITLPFSQTQSSPSALFDIVNSGTGPSGRFQINNPSSNSHVLYLQNDGTGSLLTGLSEGMGPAAYFQTSNINNDAITLSSINYGTGHASNFNIQNSLNFNNAISASTIGTGRAGHFAINNASSTNYTLSAVNTGLGRAGDFSVLNSSNTGVALHASTNGTASTAIKGVFNGTQNAFLTASAGIWGLTTSDVDGGNSYGVFGDAQGSGGIGVSGRSSDSYGVNGTSLLGTGGYFSAPAGQGIYATNNNNTKATAKFENLDITGIALETSGGLKFGGTNVGTPAAGKVLTSSDAVGNATWQDIPAIVAPLNLISNGPGTNFSSSTNGSSGSTPNMGKAGVFTNNNTLNFDPTVSILTDGFGYGLDIRSTSVGGFPAGSPFPLIYSYSLSGTAGRFVSGSTPPTIEISNTGSGAAGNFSVSGTLNNSNSINSINFGKGGAGYFAISNNSNTNTALTGVTNGLNKAGYFQIDNVTNGSSALTAITNGTGNAIDATNSSGTNPTIKAENKIDLAPAIEIIGGIKVSGTNKAAFKIVTGPYNLLNKSGIPSTTLANAATDILIVTYEYTGGTYLNKQFATFWNGGNWEIHLTDGTTMPSGITFNILVIKQ